MDATWIVSANAGRARFFAKPNATAPLQEISDMVNSASRLRASETESDGLGRRSASKSRHNAGGATPPSGYQPAQTPAEHNTELFARSVADFLLQAHQQGKYRQLMLAASPEFLGVLRKLLGPQLESAVRHEINKDYTQLGTKQIQEHIETHVREARIKSLPEA